MAAPRTSHGLPADHKLIGTKSDQHKADQYGKNSEPNSALPLRGTDLCVNCRRMFAQTPSPRGSAVIQVSMRILPSLKTKSPPIASELNEAISTSQRWDSSPALSRFPRSAQPQHKPETGSHNGSQRVSCSRPLAPCSPSMRGRGPPSLQGNYVGHSGPLALHEAPAFETLQGCADGRSRKTHLSGNLSLESHSFRSQESPVDLLLIPSKLDESALPSLPITAPGIRGR